MGQTRPLFGLFRSFSHYKYSTNLTINDKSIDGVLGTRTRGSRMVGADKSTELWRHPESSNVVSAHNERIRSKLIFKSQSFIRYGKKIFTFACVVCFLSLDIFLLCDTLLLYSIKPTWDRNSFSVVCICFTS